MNPKHGNQARWWDLPAALIMVVAVFLTSIRLSATNWTDELTIVQTVTLFAVVSGLALGQSAFSPRVAAWMSTVYGGFTIIWQLGLTFGEGVLWSERLTSLFGRLGFSLENLFRQRAVTDPIMFLFLMTVLFWLLSSHAGYTLTRYANAWRAALPLGVALFIVHIHDPFWTSRSWFLAGYIFLALLLASRTNFLHKRFEWRSTRTHMPPFVGLDFLRTTMVIGGALILLAWTAPAMAANLPPAQEAWQTIARPWYEARAKMTNAFASLRATVGVAQDYYGDVLPLGRGNTLTDAIVFTVEAPPRPAAGVRYYWRARAYETWNGSGWTADPTDFVKIAPDEASLVLPNLAGRWEADFTFTPFTSMSTIYTVPQPLWVSRPATAELLINAEGIADILRMTTSPSIRAGEQYQVHSSLTNVTEAELREAGTVYPDYITERYLQIPDAVTRRTRELAADITAEYDNPYDKVVAVTQWLRENITYQETVPVPPQNRDIIDWMLFDLNQGFCNYYATAEIVMLRSLGIPSRLAVGYAQGQRDPETNTYTVRQRDAHAWPEVFFPGIGWVEFEPTLNQRPLRRPPGDPSNSEDGNASSSSSGLSVDFQDREGLLFEAQEDQSLLNENAQAGETTPTFIESYWGWLLAGGLLILASALFTWYRNRVFDPKDPMTPLSIRVEAQLRKTHIKVPDFLVKMTRQAGLPLEARAYEQINRSLRWLGKVQEPSRTPAERASDLKVLLPDAAPTIESLIQTYHHTMYFSTNGQSTSEDTRTASLLASRTLRNRTWRALFRRYFSRFQEPAQRKPIV